MPKRENYKSEYSHTIYSNTRNRLKSKNKKLHQQRKEEALKRKEEALKRKKVKSEKPKKKIVSDGFSV